MNVLFACAASAYISTNNSSRKTIIVITTFVLVYCINSRNEGSEVLLVI